MVGKQRGLRLPLNELSVIIGASLILGEINMIMIEFSFTNILTWLGSDLIIRQERSKKIESCEQGETLW
jgi:hypothetical protein